jgi:hypothetical protein
MRTLAFLACIFLVATVGAAQSDRGAKCLAIKNSAEMQKCLEAKDNLKAEKCAVAEPGKSRADCMYDELHKTGR